MHTATDILQSDTFERWLSLNKLEELVHSFGPQWLGGSVKSWPEQITAALSSTQAGCEPHLTSIGHQPPAFHGQPLSYGWKQKKTMRKPQANTKALKRENILAPSCFEESYFAGAFAQASHPQQHRDCPIRAQPDPFEPCGTGWLGLSYAIHMGV